MTDQTAEQWTCKAKAPTDPPQDCDWPHCGCDPYAEKVLAALSEEGCMMPSERFMRHYYGASGFVPPRPAQATGEPETLAAVDPVGGTGTEGLRAPEDLARELSDLRLRLLAVERERDEAVARMERMKASTDRDELLDRADAAERERDDARAALSELRALALAEIGGIKAELDNQIEAAEREREEARAALKAITELTVYWTTVEDGIHGLDPMPLSAQERSPEYGWLRKLDVRALAEAAVRVTTAPQNLEKET